MRRNSSAQRSARAARALRLDRSRAAFEQRIRLAPAAVGESAALSLAALLRFERLQAALLRCDLPEVRALHVLALRERCSRPRQRDTAVLQHHGAVRMSERDASVLLG